MGFLEEIRVQERIETEMERIRHVHNAQYERALLMWLLKDEEAFLHAIFANWVDSCDLGRRERHDVSIRAAMYRARPVQNYQFERL